MSQALEVGYRHIDTAQMYGNEARGRRGDPRTSGLDRGDVFVTSKLNNGFHRPTTRAARSTSSLDRSGSTSSTCS